MTLSLPERAPTREQLRASTAERMLDALERLVHRHRGLALHAEHVELHAELIAAEVAHELSMMRSSLQRYPTLG